MESDGGARSGREGPVPPFGRASLADSLAGGSSVDAGPAGTAAAGISTPAKTWGSPQGHWKTS